MNRSIPRNRSKIDLVRACALVLVRAEVIITDIHVKGVGGSGGMRLQEDLTLVFNFRDAKVR